MRARVLDVVRSLLEELGSTGAIPVLSGNSHLDRDLGLGSLERVELLTRLESVFGVRVPDRVWGDLSAQYAAAQVGKRGLEKLFQRYGAATVETYMGELLDYAERVTRAEIKTWPKGTYEFLDHIDSDGFSDARIARLVSDETAAQKGFSPSPIYRNLWESWLRHEVPPNQARADRISISFNYAQR